ncbi:unnamed protein product [Tilletia laevis]|nr:hypothetical protein CF336_g8139 [Tilletia laevis]KAE8243045.1 hypothetical protein A4X03_0g7887 [Tilletia caries]KAE8184624.1 hypothetical protein CF335_g7963 [Tilletia laevis]CAD6897615.1 unnamed protein product [Tilletia caries]CAD6912808.1 unnamed protein product [Tilletia laevis]
MGLPHRAYSTGRPRKLGAEDIAYVMERLNQCADLMLDELAGSIEAVGGPKVSKSLVSRTLQRLDITRKRLRRRASEADLNLEAACRLRMARYLPEQLIFVDETGFDSRTGQRRFGWAPAGDRAVQVGTGKRTRRATLIPGLTVDGMIAPKIYHSTVNADVFYDYLITYLLPQTTPFPGPGSVIVMDNVPFHRSPKIKQLVRRFGCRIEYVAPWSPWMNPIEEAFSKIKASLRRSGSTFDYDVLIACDSITSGDAEGWIRNAGYL